MISNVGVGDEGGTKVSCADDSSVVAPHGQEEIPELRSVFELPHLMENAVFLDTQCTLSPTSLNRTSSQWLFLCRQNAEGRRGLYLSSCLRLEAFHQTHNSR